MEQKEELINSLLSRPHEEEWFELKGSWYDAHGIGEYISALSNAAATCGVKHGYLVWGADDVTHEPIGTSFNYHKNYKGEPLQHYLARLTNPGIAFVFSEIIVATKRMVLLTVPAATKVPTSFDGVRYIRIGSSKESVTRYPEREAQLFSVLSDGFPTLVNIEAKTQNLSFERLFTFYAGRGITLRRETFGKNLNLLTNSGSFNMLAQLLSDDCGMPIRVSIFRGKSKAAPLYSVREFGHTCILTAMDKVLEYADVLDVVQADENNRGLQRADVPLFNRAAFHEALVNAFVHNSWISGNAPMVTVYSDRIEILSRGRIAPEQTMEGFFAGESVPVNQELSDVFLQLHISERSGRGVPKITEIYGRDAFEFRENSIVVTLPFVRIGEGHGANTGCEIATIQERVLAEIRNNPNITQPRIAETLGVGKTSVQTAISKLKKCGSIERVGSNKSGYWRVL